MEDQAASTLVEELPRSVADPSDFESFYRSEHARLFRGLYLLSGRRHDAEELMQEAFLRLWERWDRLRHHPDLRRTCIAQR